MKVWNALLLMFRQLFLDFFLSGIYIAWNDNILCNNDILFSCRPLKRFFIKYVSVAVLWFFLLLLYFFLCLFLRTSTKKKKPLLLFYEKHWKCRCILHDKRQINLCNAEIVDLSLHLRTHRKHIVMYTQTMGKVEVTLPSTIRLQLCVHESFASHISSNK